MRHFSTLIFLLLGFLLQAQLPDTLYIYPEQFEAISQEKVEVPIRVNNYQKIEALQFSINWDPHQLAFDSILAINPASKIKLVDIGLSRTDQGLLVLSFVDPITGGISLPDSSSLFTIQYTAIGEPSKKVPLNISDYDREIDAYGQGLFRTVIAGKTLNKIKNPLGLHMYTHSCSPTKLINPNGEIKIKAFGGVEPMSLSFRPLNSQSSTLYIIGNGSITQLDSLSPGSYEIRIRDAAQQEIIDTISMSRTGEWELDLELVQPSCANTNNGSARINHIAGGVEPYVFTWSTFDILSPALTHIGNGAYYIRIEDKLGCIYEELFTLETPAPKIHISHSPASCQSIADGSINAQVIQGIPYADSTYTFILDTFPAVQARSFSASNLSAGTHRLTIIDSMLCSFTYSIHIGLEHGIQILDSTKLNVGCDGTLGGYILTAIDTGQLSSRLIPTLVPDLGTISQTDSLIKIENLPEGTYTLFLDYENDSLSCGKTLQFTVTMPTFIDIDLDTIKHETCLGKSNGILDVKATGGLGSFYTFTWADGTVASHRDNLGPGIYCLTVTDDSGCKSDTCFTIEPGMEYELIIDTVQDLRCPGIAEGKIDFHIQHLSGEKSDSFTVNVNPPVNIAIINDSLYRLDSLVAGAYTIKITNNFSCTIDTTINVGEPQFPSIHIDSIQDAGCYNAPTGYIDLYAMLDGDTTTAVKWLWSTGDTTPRIQNLTAGSYELSLTDAHGCSYSKSYYIDSIGGPVVQSITMIPPSCYGSDDGSVSFDSLFSIAGIQSYAWEGIDSTWSMDTLKSGFYTYEVVDSAMCRLRDSIFLPQPDSLMVTVLTEDETSNELGSASINISGGTPPYEITWSTVPPIKNDTFIHLSAGNYSVIVLDQNACIKITNFKIDNRTSINYIDQKHFSLFPNPADDKLHLFLDDNVQYNLSDRIGYRLKIVNIHGEKIHIPYQVHNKRITILTSLLTPGTYFIILSHNDKIIYNNAFLIQR